MDPIDRRSAGDSLSGGRPASFRRQRRRETLLLFGSCLLLYTLTNYGGIRSPDNEVVFRAALSFVDHGRLDVGRSLEDWPGFGLARARDGRDYPVFGPVASLAQAPLILFGQAVLSSPPGPATHLPVSFYVPGGLMTALYGAPPSHLDAHALRLFGSYFNVIMAALAVVVFHRILRRLPVSSFAAAITTAFFAAGSLLWPYAGACFSEPLALVFLLLAFEGTLAFEPPPVGETDLHPGRVARAGLCLGLAVATHISAALFIPFLAWLPVSAARRKASPRPRAAFAWSVGLLVALAGLGLYNLARFGSLFETGRGVSPEAAYEFGYGVWTSPLRGLYGLLVSPGKGLLLTCPAVLLGILAWPVFHRKHRRLSFLLAAAAVTRLVFLAARSDWHGGFCLGPRYLLLSTPFLLLPIGPAIDAWATRPRRWLRPAIGLALFLCVAQQLWFCLGEIFRFYHHAIQRAERAGLDPFAGDQIYLSPHLAPLTHLLSGARGPHLLRGIGLDNFTLWLLGSLLAAAAIAATLRPRRSRPQAPAAH